MNEIIFCDFDGTITANDTCVLVLSKFADDDWQIYDERLMKGEITLEECMQRQFKMVKATANEILLYLDKTVNIRKGFKEFIKHAESRNIPIVVVSAGLDFVINHFLEKEGYREHIGVVAAKTDFTSNGIGLRFPRKKFNDSLDFKQDLVRYFKQQGKEVYYIGDGISDFQAVTLADKVFVVNDSKLARECQSKDIPFFKFTDFHDIIRILEIK